MPSPETPRSSTSSVPDSDADIGLRQAWTGSALPISLQSVSRGVNVFGASTVRTFVTACQFARPPCKDPTGFPAVGDFYYQASNGSVALPVAGYNYNSDWTPLLVGFAPTGMAASLAAPKLSFILGTQLASRGLTTRGSPTMVVAPALAPKILLVAEILRFRCRYAAALGPRLFRIRMSAAAIKTQPGSRRRVPQRVGESAVQASTSCQRICPW